MEMTVKNLYKVLDYIVDNAKEEDYTLNIKYDTNNTLIIDGGEILNYVEDNYSNYCFVYRESALHPKDPERVFNRMWRTYVDMSMHNWERVLTSLYADYNPISNYDMKESSADGVKRGGQSQSTSNETKTATGSKVSDTVDTTSYGDNGQKTTVEHFVNGFDDTDYKSGVPANKDITTLTGNMEHDIKYKNDINIADDDAGLVDNNLTGYTRMGGKTSGTETIEYTNNLALDTAGGNSDMDIKYNETNTHYLTRFGNIGITSSQQLIMSEVELRKYNLIESIVDTFAERYLFYVGGEC